VIIRATSRFKQRSSSRG